MESVSRELHLGAGLIAKPSWDPEPFWGSLRASHQKLGRRCQHVCVSQTAAKASAKRKKGGGKKPLFMLQPCGRALSPRGAASLPPPRFPKILSSYSSKGISLEETVCSSLTDVRCFDCLEARFPETCLLLALAARLTIKRIVVLSWLLVKKMPFWVILFHETNGEADGRLTLGILHFGALIARGFFSIRTGFSGN